MKNFSSPKRLIEGLIKSMLPLQFTYGKNDYVIIGFLHLNW